MNRKEQIFATKKIAGMKVPASKSKTAESAQNLSSIALKKCVDNLNADVNNTLLKSFSYKLDEDIYSIENAKVKSISKGNKHVCFLVSGDSTVIDQKEALSSMPQGLEYLKEKLSETK